MSTDNVINAIITDLKYENIHMSAIKDRKIKNNIISRLKFDEKENVALCLRIDRTGIICRILKMRKARRNRTSKGKIMRTYHYLLAHHIRKYTEEFLFSRGKNLSDVVFQCDGDSRNFLKDSGLHHTDVGNAHNLADVVAWANSSNMEPKGVVSVDLTGVLEEGLIKKIC